MRKIQSFVRRKRRLSASQQYALNNLWSNYGVALDENKQTDFATIFAHNKPLILEIGFGNGDSLLTMAENNPQQNYLGIEVYQAGIGRLLVNANKLGLRNLKVINADATEVLKNNIKNNSLAGLQLFFPDPWPKKKHHKRRIMSAQFLQLLAEKLITGGFLHMATDWQDYAEQIKSILKANKNFKNSQNSANDALIFKRPPTKFECKGMKLGHRIWDFIFIFKP